MENRGASSLSLRQIEQFLVLGEELHFGRAARRLGMHQAPLSQAIQKLEIELGLQLFERSHRHVALTPAGSALLDDARAIVDRVQAFSERARRLSGGIQGTLTVGFVSTAIYGYLPRLISAFRERYPEVELRLREATSDVQIELLALQELDVGLVIDSSDGVIRGIRTHPVRSDRLIAALPAVWDEARFADGASGNAELRRLARETLITIPRRIGPTLFDAIQECFAQRGIVPNVGQEGIQMQTILGLVAAGLGYAIVPESMRSLARADVRYLDIEGGAPEVVLCIGWRASDPNPVVRNLIRLATETQRR